MRLLLTCHRDPFTHVGGSEEAIKQLSLELARRGHRVTVITRKEPDVPYQAIYDTTGRPLDFHIGPVKHVESLAAFEPHGRGVFRTNRHLSDFCGHFEWDAVFLFGQNVWVTDEIWRDVGWWRQVYSHAKVIYFPVGFPGFRRRVSFYARLLNLPYYRMVQRHIIEQSDAVVALTDQEAADIQRIGHPRQLARIPLGIDYHHFQDDSGDHSVERRFGIQGPYILNVGGDYENKCLADACLGVRELNKFYYEKMTLVLIGIGTEQYQAPYVRGLGVVSEADKIALYHEARLLLHTSDFEGFGIVLLEALASGVPFVSTDVGVARELARKWGGGIVGRRTPKSIAYHLWHELETERDPDELRAVAKSYDWPTVAAELLKLCK